VGIGMINEDIEPCPYHIQISMGASRKVYGLPRLTF